MTTIVALCALAQDLSGGSAIPVAGCENLEVMEVQTDAAVARFREAVGGFRAADLGLGGVAEEALSQLGLHWNPRVGRGLHELLGVRRLWQAVPFLELEEGSPEQNRVDPYR